MTSQTMSDYQTQIHSQIHTAASLFNAKQSFRIEQNSFTHEHSRPVHLVLNMANNLTLRALPSTFPHIKVEDAESAIPNKKRYQPEKIFFLLLTA